MLTNHMLNTREKELIHGTIDCMILERLGVRMCHTTHLSI
jgi:hypothetical protein